jgi:hypothetical protein
MQIVVFAVLGVVKAGLAVENDHIVFVLLRELHF